MYNENGLRVKKIIQPSEYDTANAVETNYTLHGKNIVHMTQGSNELHFFYDAQNKPAVVVFNGTPYSYVKNLQGDIVAILDSTGSVVVEYKYDAWGKPFEPTGSMKDDLGKLNPFRYRGYVYDEETGLYYLRSRFYVSSHSRFLNMDSVLPCASFRLGNPYTYCGNSPVRNTDQSGAGWFDSVCSWCEDTWNSACSWASEVAYPELINAGNQLLDCTNKALGTVYVIFDSASVEIGCGVGISRSTGTLIDVGIDFSWSTTISYNLFDHFSSAQKLTYSSGLSYNGSTHKNQNIGPSWGYNGSYVHEYNDPLCSCKYNSPIFSTDCPAAHVEEDTGIDWVVGIPLRKGPFFWYANAIYDIDGACDRINRIWTSEDTVYKICFEE